MYKRQVNTDAKNCFWPADDRYGSNVSNEQSGNSAGTATNDFNSDDVLVGLQANAGSDVKWVSGIGHPTFVWDANNIPADYTAVDAAIARETALDSSLYTNYSAVEDSITSVDRAKSKAQQTEVDAMAKAIEDAIAALQYKDADYTKVDAAIAKANALKKNDYKDFSAVEGAVNAVARGKNITEQSEVDAMAKVIEEAINALVGGHVDIAIGSPPTYRDYVINGQLNCLGTFIPEGLDVEGIGHIASFKEQGIDVEFTGMDYLAVRSSVDPRIQEKLREFVLEVYADPEFQAFMAGMGMKAWDSDAAEILSMIDSQTEAMSQYIPLVQ